MGCSSLGTATGTQEAGQLWKYGKAIQEFVVGFQIPMSISCVPPLKGWGLIASNLNVGKSLRCDFGASAFQRWQLLVGNPVGLLSHYERGLTLGEINCPFLP